MLCCSLQLSLLRQYFLEKMTLIISFQVEFVFSVTEINGRQETRQKPFYCHKMRYTILTTDQRFITAHFWPSFEQSQYVFIWRGTNDTNA